MNVSLEILVGREQIASMSLDLINVFVQREGLEILSLPVNLL